MEIALGHSAWQAPVLVQLPKPSSSILATIALARRAPSTRPCGSLASDDTRAATKSIAEPFLHVAAQAPQPTQAAASIDSSASAFGIGMALPSGTELVRTEMNPPEEMLENPATDQIRDFLGKHHAGPSPEQLTVDHFMRTGIITVNQNRGVNECVSRMQHHNVDTLLVVDEYRHYQGTVSIADIRLTGQ